MEKSQLPFCISFDGPNFSGKTTTIDAVKSNLLTSYDFLEDDIHIVKFGKEDSFKEEFKEFSKKLDEKGLYNEPSQKVLRMLRWMFEESKFWKEYVKNTEAKIVLMDRGLVSFVVNRGIDLGLSEQEILKLRKNLSTSDDVFCSDIVVHVDASEGVLKQRAEERKKEELTAIDKQTLNNIGYEQGLYRKVFQGIGTERQFMIDTSYPNKVQESIATISKNIFTLFSQPDV